jgi:hypothetical protein
MKERYHNLVRPAENWNYNSPSAIASLCLEVP